MPLRPTVWIILAAAAVVTGCGSHSAAKPARPGGAANDVFSIARDGSGLRNLTRSPTATEQFVSVAPDGRTLAFFRRGNLILRNGESERRLDRNYQNILDWGARPAWSPNGRKVAVTKGRGCFSDDGCDHWPLSLVDVKSGASRRIARDGVLPWWLPDGRLGFTGGFRFIACHCAGQVEWAPTRLVVAGRKLAVGKEPVAVAWGNSIAYTSIPSRGLYVMNSDGTRRRRLPKVRVEGLAPTPDGRKLAFSCDYGRLCLLSRDRRTVSRLGRNAGGFAWSRDSRFLAWVQFACPRSRPPCVSDIYVLGPDRTPRRITHNSAGARIDAVGWTGNGRIVFTGTGIRWHRGSQSRG